jgi:putative ABC transport system permease protein
MTRLGKGMMLAFAGVALLVLNVQLFSHGADVPKDILTKKNPVASSDAVLAAAKSAYEENCLMCHGEAGKGDGPMAGMLKERPSDLTDTKNFTEMTDGEIFWIITKGVKPMPPFENKISEDNRWGLVNLMRSMSKTKPNTTPKKH